ncbi:MAG: DUF177 domain-containing protein [Pyrinomonadaceae bacterium]
MIIDLDSVGKLSKMVEAAFAADEIDLDGGAMLTGLVNLKAEITRDGTRTEVQGTIKADSTVRCTRCLERISMPFDIAFDDIFVDSSEEDTQDDAEVNIENLDESLLTEGQIDLREVVREQLLLAIPEQIFCREDCQGLCPQCGGNRNLIDCSCEKDEIDPRWAALKNLK